MATFSQSPELSTIPLPVAFPLAWAHDASLPVEKRLDNVVFATYQACETVCPALGVAIRGLRMPHWSEWSRLCTQLCQFWEGRLDPKPERESNFPELVHGWREVARAGRLPADSTGSPVLAGLPGHSGPATSANEAVWKLRDLRAHRKGTATHDSSRDATDLERLLPLVDQLVSKLFDGSKFELIRKVDDTLDQMAVNRLT